MNLDANYFLRHAARAAKGNSGSLWKIASNSDLFGEKLDLSGCLTQEQIEATQAFIKKRLIALSVLKMNHLEASNFQTAYSHFVANQPSLKQG